MNISTTTTTKHRLNITGIENGEILTQRWGSRTRYQVDTVRVAWTSHDDGKTWKQEAIFVAGPKLKQDGSHSKVRTDDTLYSRDELPGWLSQLVIENAPAAGA
jgi:hypothetical protein